MYMYRYSLVKSQSVVPGRLSQLHRNHARKLIYLWVVELDWQRHLQHHAIAAHTRRTGYTEQNSVPALANIFFRKHRTFNDKAVLSQRWPRDAPYIWMPGKCSGVPDGYSHGYTFRNCQRAFVAIDRIKVRTKCEVRSFTCSKDSRRYPHSLCLKF